MTDLSLPTDFRQLLETHTAQFSRVNEAEVVQSFGDESSEYTGASTSVGLYPALDRGTIEIGGGDRAAWLNNLVTNEIKNLKAGEGNYAFAPTVKGRILFDLNMLVLPELLWLDLDSRSRPTALAHFDRYTITEDVSMTDRTEEFVRLVMSGPATGSVAAKIGVPQAASMASLGSTQATVAGTHCLLVRHDFAGVLGVELFVPSDRASAAWSELLELCGAEGGRPVGRSAVETLRIEAGIPAMGAEITDEVLPAETRQLERAVSYVKGCYLGQEVVERMRSRGGLARQLVGLKLEADGLVQPGAKLRHEEKEVGRITSCCVSPKTGGTIALGYLRTSAAQPGTIVDVMADPTRQAEVAELPFSS